MNKLIKRREGDIVCRVAAGCGGHPHPTCSGLQHTEAAGWEQRAICGSVGVHQHEPLGGDGTYQQRAMPICILHMLKRMEELLLPSTASGWWRGAGYWDMTWPAQAKQSSQPGSWFPRSPWPQPCSKPQLSAKAASPIPCPFHPAKVCLSKCVCDTSLCSRLSCTSSGLLWSQ